MLGLIPVADVLTMLTVDDDDTADSLYVSDVLDHKRRSPHYTELLDDVRKDGGFDLPIMIRTYRGNAWLTDGHHRVAAAIDAGITHIPWSDLPLEIEDHRHNPVTRSGWGPYRPPLAA